MGKKAHLTPHEQRDSFARAFDIVQAYLAADNFIGAYIVAFSILEDRIATMYAACVQGKTEGAGQSRKQRHQPLSEKMRLLVKRGVITSAEQQAWTTLANERNQKLHEAMWNLDEFNAADVEIVIAAARRASNLRKVQKRADARHQQHRAQLS